MKSIVYLNTLCNDHLLRHWVRLHFLKKLTGDNSAGCSIRGKKSSNKEKPVITTSLGIPNYKTGGARINASYS